MINPMTILCMISDFSCHCPSERMETQLYNSLTTRNTSKNAPTKNKTFSKMHRIFNIPKKWRKVRQIFVYRNGYKNYFCGRQVRHSLDKS